jgi:hypothetical protein
MFPQIPILSFMAIRTPSTDEICPAFSRAAAMWEGLLTMLPSAVAAASARAASFETTVTASAFPKLREWPMVPDEVQMERGKRSP